jgi:hypothetical protein
VKRRLALLGALVAAAPLGAATLERLSLDEMIGKSTSIVRAKVMGAHAAFSGNVIYTHYSLQVLERLKGSGPMAAEVAVPGGSANGLQQTFSGAPEFATGRQYVLFLWTGPTGLNQVIGLTQGIFTLDQPSAADPVATRAASHELMLAPGSGRAVKDQTLGMRLSELRARIAGLSGSAGRAVK